MEKLSNSWDWITLEDINNVVTLELYTNQLDNMVMSLNHNLTEDRAIYAIKKIQWKYKLVKKYV